MNRLSNAWLTFETRVRTGIALWLARLSLRFYGRDDFLRWQGHAVLPLIAKCDLAATQKRLEIRRG